MDILVKDVSKSYDGKCILNHFSCVFKENKFNCLMGKSGIGKTTLLRILMQLENTDAGVIEGLADKKLSVVFQENRLCENLDAVLNVRMVTDKDENEILSMLAAVDIDGKDKKLVKEYSGGMKRRVAIVRALMADFDLLIMDEPLKGLDIETKEMVVNLIREETQGKTVIMVTHDEEECELFGAEIVKM